MHSKKRRILRGQAPRTLDLFCGAGGMSLGFKAAGYEILGGIDSDLTAAETYALNFHATPIEALEQHRQCRDITAVEPSDFVAELAPDADPDELVDAIIGGPPCQAFARIGRAKLREIATDPEAYRRDERAKLYTSFLHYVRELKPLIIVMENVPDALNYGGHNVAEEICQTLDDEGYQCRYTLLNAVQYGVPQFRDRLFLIGLARELNLTPTFPQPTHRWPVPDGYKQVRKYAFRRIDSKKQPTPLAAPYLILPPEPEPDVLSAPTVEAAIADLPLITLHLHGGLRRGVRRFTELAPYPADVTPSSYARLMRSWLGYEAGEGIWDHVIRHLPRDYPIFARMRPGDQYPEALAHARDILAETLTRLRAQGQHIPEDSDRYQELQQATVPPYDPSKFPNRWRKLDRCAPVRTLTAHLGKDSYTHIHYDDRQARTISVREAARLQSFPDGFQFAGAMNAAFRQIGNAVPPLLANAVAEHLLQTIRNTNGLEKVRD